MTWTKLAQRVLLAVTGLLIPLFWTTPLFPQTPITFRYFYDATGQLTRVVDSTGVSIEYIYDSVGNMLEIKRAVLPSPGALTIFSFNPQQGGPLALVTIQGLGFASSPAANIVRFNGIQATVLAASATSLTVSVPANATSGPLSVTVGSDTAQSGQDFLVLPSPAITSLTPRFALAGTSGQFQVSGFNLQGAAFRFEPAISPMPVTIASASVGSGGTSTQLNLNISQAASGTFTLVATTAAGSSSLFATPSNSLNILRDAEADSDGDGYPDGLELLFGSDPLDPNSVPNLTSTGDIVSAVVSVLNNVQPATGQPAPMEVVSALVSVLNNVLPATGQPTSMEAISAMVSVLNNVSPALSQSVQMDVVSAMVSVLNNVMPASGVTQMEVLGPLFSVFNQPQSSPLTTSESAGGVAAGATASLNRNETSPAAVQPRLTISPEPGGELIEGETIEVRAEFGETEISEVEFSVNDKPMETDRSAPYTLLFTVPAGVNRLSFSAAGRHADGTFVSIDPVEIAVSVDSKTGVEGRAIDLNGNALPGAAAGLIAQGLRAEFFEFTAPLNALPDVESLKPSEASFVSAINIRNPDRVFGRDPFGAGLAPDYSGRFRGWLRIPVAGTYQFFLGADEAASLNIGGTTVVSMTAGDGQYREESGNIPLAAGIVPIEITFYQGVGTGALQLSFLPPNGERQVVRPDMFIGVMAVTTTDSQGNFRFNSVESNAGRFQIEVFTNLNDRPAAGFSDLIEPIREGTSATGNIQVRPVN